MTRRRDGIKMGEPMAVARETIRAAAWGVLFTLVLGVLIVLGSRGLEHVDAALVGYTFATLFATFGITYRYAMWLQRPPTRMYWRRGWQVFLAPRHPGRKAAQLSRRLFLEFAANPFIFRRGALRGSTLLIMWAAHRGPITSRSWGWISSERCRSASKCTGRSSSDFQPVISRSNHGWGSSSFTASSGLRCSSSPA